MSSSFGSSSKNFSSSNVSTKLTPSTKNQNAKHFMTNKKKNKKILKSVGKEIKQNPPRVLAKTAKKSGKAQADKQKVAILLSKARKAGAKIPGDK